VSRALRILYVAYPLLTVSRESAGGAEQVLWTLEREMARRGAFTTVAASTGSRVSRHLFPTGLPCRDLDDFERRNREHQDRVVEFVRRQSRAGTPFDLVHDMSGSFWPQASEIPVPLLATLHLPRAFYSAALLRDIPTNASFNCVSESQARSFADWPRLAGVVPNGVALDLLPPNLGSRRGLLWLGRICEEKAPHLALEIAGRAGIPLTIAGQVYPFSSHRQYFERYIVPQLSPSKARFIESPSMELKRRLLRQSRAVLITSQVEETSSLVAIEAAASATPVIAFSRGALPEVVRHAVTGLLVEDSEGALAALAQLGGIDAQACAEHARRRFGSVRMTQGYVRLYRRLLAPGPQSSGRRQDDKLPIPAV
jgi:glycosyltransferase involved in cell wall biosynthesis